MHLGDFATVLLDLVCLSLFMSFQTDWMMFRSDLCVEHWLLSDTLCKQKSHWIITINGKLNICKCKLIFPTYTLQQKIEITDLKPFLAAENTSVRIILAITVFKNLFENNEFFFLWSIFFFFLETNMNTESFFLPFSLF